ncbi:MAG: hypothetical protein AB7F59_00885 [Bdellovibrionales bacterium]
MRLLTLITCLSTLLFLASCGKDKKKPDGDDGELTPQSPITGSWTSECTLAPAPHGGNYYQLHALRFSQSTYTLETQIFSENTCSDFLKREYVVKKTGRLVTSEDPNKDDQLLPINDEAAGYAIKTSNPQNTELFTQAKVCGVTDWKLDTYKSVSGKTCWNKNIFDLQIFYTTTRAINTPEKATLEFAVTSAGQDGRSPEKRATQFTSSLIFTKK